MNVYILKVYAVVPGTPTANYEIDHVGQRFCKWDDAKRFVDWWKYDQGRRDSFIFEDYVECPVVDGNIVIPDNILR